MASWHCDCECHMEMPEAKTLTLPYSEVCMHMKVAGTRMYAELRPKNMVQLFDDNGRAFSFPITRGEAGWDMS